MTFYHILKLFQPPSPDAPMITNADGTIVPPPPVIDTKKRLVSEFYDEIVFYEPSQLMQQMLNTIQPVTNGSWVHDTDCKIISNFCSVLPHSSMPSSFHSWRQENQIAGAHSWDSKESQSRNRPTQGKTPTDPRKNFGIQRRRLRPESSTIIRKFFDNSSAF